MAGDDTAAEFLRDRIGRDEAEPLQPCVLFRQQFGGAVPPEHHQIGRAVDARVRRPQRRDIRIAQPLAQVLAADEGRVADDVVGFRPVGASRGPAVVQRQECVLRADVAEAAQHRIGDRAAALQVPLEVSDPQHQLGDRRRTRIDLQPQEMARIDGAIAQPQRFLPAQRRQRLQHFALELLHQHERDVQEIAGAARRVEHARGRQPSLKRADRGDRGGQVVRPLALHGAEHDAFPFAAQRRDDRRDHQPFDIGARRIVCAQPTTLADVERLFEQRAEYRGLDIGP